MPVLNFITTKLLFFSGLAHFVLGSPATNRSSHPRSSNCTAYEIVSARGTGESQVNPRNYAPFIRDVLLDVPGGQNYEVIYPADINYAVSPGIGAKQTMEHLTSQSQDCPEQKYVLLGYSEGAMVITQYLYEANFSTRKIAAVVLFGNPYHVPNARRNHCGGIDGYGNATPLAQLKGTVLPANYYPITFDCCIQGDPVCQTQGVISKHLAYAKSPYEREAADFTVTRLRALL